MNIELIKNEIENHLNERVVIEVYGMRNKNFKYEGTIKSAYPYLFTVEIDGTQKSFNYADLITGDVVVKYL